MIIYTYPLPTAFTERDVEMIRPHFRIKPLAFTHSPLQLPFYFILQFFQLLFFLPKTSHYLCFFGGYHSVLPTLFGKWFTKKVFIQCGGADAMNMPEINYGNFRKKWLRKATVFSFRNCSKILPVAGPLIKQEYLYDPRISPNQGLLNLIPNLTTPIEVIHNGFDTDFWTDKGEEKKPWSFISVATGIAQENRMAVKGVDLILMMAENFPDYRFTLVGDDNFKSDISNVRITGKVDSNQLKDLFNQHQFYLQLSTSEGFPNALAEAMLCGCIPIGSAVGGIPEIIGKYGFILQQKDPEKLRQIFEGLPSHDLGLLRKGASKQIQNNFSYAKRQNALLSLFSS